MINAIAAIDPTAGLSVSPQAVTQTLPGQRISFSDMLHQGVVDTDSKIAEANRLVAAFTLDDSIPAHQVTFALEQARLSLELMIQVRNRMVESYQQLMNMQV